MNQISDDNEQEVETFANMVTELKGIEATTLEDVKHETEKVSYCVIMSSRLPLLYLVI